MADVAIETDQERERQNVFLRLAVRSNDTWGSRRGGTSFEM
jgi:hypothetical protein